MLSNSENKVLTILDTCVVLYSILFVVIKIFMYEFDKFSELVEPAE